MTAAVVALTAKSRIHRHHNLLRFCFDIVFSKVLCKIGPRGDPLAAFYREDVVGSEDVAWYDHSLTLLKSPELSTETGGKPDTNEYRTRWSGMLGFSQMQVLKHDCVVVTLRE